MSFCRLAWKEKVVKGGWGTYWATFREDGRVGGIKAWLVYWLAASSGVSYRVLLLLLGCEGMPSLQFRWLVTGAWTGHQTKGKLDCSCTPRLWSRPFWVAAHGRSAKPMGAHWDGKIANEWNIGVKHIQTYSNSNINKLVKMQFSVETKTRIFSFPI